MDDEITYKVSIYDKLDTYTGKKRTTYYVRWRVNEREWKVPFDRAGQAGSFRSSLVTAAKQGEAFSVTTGRPVSWQRGEPEASKTPPVNWYALTLDYTAAKWKYASPNHRRSIAAALTDATEALLTSDLPCTRPALTIDRLDKRVYLCGQRSPG